MTNKEIIKNIFKQTSARITILITLIFSLIFPLISINYIIPSFEEQIMINTVDDAKKVSQYLYGKYKKTNKFSEIKSIKKDLDIYKIKLFDPKGLTIYSTSKKNIGKINKHSHFQDIIAKGNSYYKIVKKGKKALEGQIIELDIAEVYIPIMENNTFKYAFEIYYDISSEVKNFNDLTYKMKVINLFIIFLFIFLINQTLLKKHIKKNY